MAGALPALARPWEAAYHNPALAAREREFGLALEYSYAAPRLYLNDTPAEVIDAHGFTLGVSLPIDSTNLSYIP